MFDMSYTLCLLIVPFMRMPADTQHLKPNPDEVSECFTIPIDLLLDTTKWVHDEHHVAFLGGPHVIWGLTAYVLDRFLKETVRRYSIADASGELHSPLPHPLEGSAKPTGRPS